MERDERWKQMLDWIHQQDHIAPQDVYGLHERVVELLPEEWQEEAWLNDQFMRLVHQFGPALVGWVEAGLESRGRFEDLLIYVASIAKEYRQKDAFRMYHPDAVEELRIGWGREVAKASRCMAMLRAAYERIQELEGDGTQRP